jgi:hypothetical protein
MTEDIPLEVRISTESGLAWEFVTPSSAMTCAEQAEEMVHFCEQLYDAFGTFLVPIEINYAISIYEQNTELRPDSDSGEVVTRKLRNDDGIRVSEFKQSTETDGTGVRWIPRVPFDKNRYKISLDGADHAVERSDCIPYRKGEPRQNMNVSDPLRVSANHRESRNYPSVTAEHVLTVSVSMASDIWLRASEDGRNNRAYLMSFFEDIADAISATSVQRDKYGTSDFWNDLSVYSGDDDYIELEPEVIY